MAETFASPTPTLFAEAGGAPITNATPMLTLQSVDKIFGGKGAATQALNDVSFTVHDGEFIGIMGPSGSGKSTLLNCVATIDKVTSGHILIDGDDITTMSNRRLAAFRRNELGFVFQDFNLLDTLTGYENIALALTIKGVKARTIPERVKQIARALGVDSILDKYPYQMSGGQCQRIAAARAIVADPKLILADEPTGALDSRAATVMLETLEMMNRVLSATIMMVTHDSYAASFTHRVLFLKDGKLFNEIRRGDLSREDFFARILEVVAYLGGGQSHGA